MLEEKREHDQMMKEKHIWAQEKAENERREAEQERLEWANEEEPSTNYQREEP